MGLARAGSLGERAPNSGSCGARPPGGSVTISSLPSVFRLCPRWRARRVSSAQRGRGRVGRAAGVALPWRCRVRSCRGDASDVATRRASGGGGVAGRDRSCGQQVGARGRRSFAPSASNGRLRLPRRRCAGRQGFGGRPRLGMGAAVRGIRPASLSARRSSISIWALRLRSSSLAHRASASWTAGSKRSGTCLRSVFTYRASRC